MKRSATIASGAIAGAASLIVPAQAKLWMPPKPAIIRAASLHDLKPVQAILPGFCIPMVVGAAASTPPSFVANQAGNENNASPVSVDLPSGRDANSITIIVASVAWAGGSFGTLSIGSGTSESQLNNTGNAWSSRIAWLRGSAGTTVSISGSGGSGVSAIGGYCVHFSGCVTSGTPYEGYATTNGTSTSTTHTSPSTVTTGTNRLGVRIWVRDDSRTTTLDSGWTERRDASIDDLTWLFHSSSVYTKTIATASTEAAASATASGTCTWQCHGIGLIPA